MPTPTQWSCNKCGLSFCELALAQECENQLPPPEFPDGMIFGVPRGERPNPAQIKSALLILSTHIGPHYNSITIKEANNMGGQTSMNKFSRTFKVDAKNALIIEPHPEFVAHAAEYARYLGKSPTVYCGPRGAIPFEEWEATARKGLNYERK